MFGRQEDQAAIGSAAQLEPTMATALPIEISIAFPGLPAGYTNDDLALGVETVSRQRGVESDDLQTYWQFDAGFGPRWPIGRAYPGHSWTPDSVPPLRGSALPKPS